MGTEGNPLFDQAAAVFSRAASEVSSAGAASLLAAGLIDQGVKLATSAMAQKAHMSPTQQVIISNVLGSLVAAVSGVSQGAWTVVQIASQIQNYGKLEAQRAAVSAHRVQVLAELAAAGTTWLDYRLEEARLRGGEAAFTEFAMKYQFASDMSLTLGAVLTLNPVLAIVGGAFAAIDHAIWTKRNDAMRARRNRAIAQFAIEFMVVYTTRDEVQGMIAAFRRDEDKLFVDERIARLREIKTKYGGGASDRVFDVLTLPDQNFVYGIDALTGFYVKVEAMGPDELDRMAAAARSPAKASPAAGGGLLVAGWLAFMTWLALRRRTA